ncbi:MAG: M3 family oligoendopeptidase, partial [Cetobacterium sp.]
MKFSEFKYERPNLEEIKTSYDKLLEELKNSLSPEEEYKKAMEINEIRNRIFSMGSIGMIRHTINTEDEFYDKENDYWDEYSPYYEELDNKFYKAMVESKNRDYLEEKMTKQFFILAENGMKAFSSEIIEELQEENKLSSEYQKLIASAKITFQGEIRNLSGMIPFLMDRDREVRKNAGEKIYRFYEENEKKIDEIFHKLVQVRNKMAKKLGYKNFVELGYIRMNRSDYNPTMVENFRKQVREYI